MENTTATTYRPVLPAATWPSARRSRLVVHAACGTPKGTSLSPFGRVAVQLNKSIQLPATDVFVDAMVGVPGIRSGRSWSPPV